MTRIQKAIENHAKGYNCAQAVACAFADKTKFTEDEIFRLTEAFGGGMGGTGGVCGAVSAMVFLAGLSCSLGVEALPQTNKKASYAKAAELMVKFEQMNTTVECSKLKGDGIRSCDGCIEDAVKILEENL